MNRILVFAALVAACSSGKTITGGEPGSIEGTVSASSQALTVAVPGTSQSTTTDTTGAFVLTNVPAGTTALHLSGGTDDATVQFGALVSSEHRTMSIVVSGK